MLNEIAFGKLRRDEQDRIAAWLPLTDHLADVALCFVCLCRCRSIRRALDTAAGRALDDRDIQRLAALVFLHDLGKVNSGFQAKRWMAGERPDCWPLPAGHGVEATLLFNDPTLDHLVHALPVDELCGWGDAIDPLLRASISHHGRPIVEDPVLISNTCWQPIVDRSGSVLYHPLDMMKTVAEKLQALFPEAFDEPERYLPESPPFGHLFAGLVQLADWLGSDTRHFGYDTSRVDREKNARKWAKNAIDTLGLDADAAREDLRSRSPDFRQVFQVPAPHPIQAAMGDETLGPLLILESETGSGKTEAALWRYVRLFKAGQVDALYFALPTRVSAQQVHDRVRKAVARLWPENAPVVVRALPGYSAADGKEPVMLPDFKVQWHDNPDDKKAHSRWAAETPKRFLAAPIAIGTIDQALLGILKVRHAHMRLALLARSLLVVDEVHASDAYMTRLLEHLLRAHLGYGGHALLLSATLGSKARARFLSLAQHPSPVEAPDFEAARTTPYPAISDFGRLRPAANTGRGKAVSWSLHPCMDDPDAIARLAIRAARQGAKVLIVRNTVPSAMAVFSAIESQADPAWLFAVNSTPTLHHSRFSRQDRPLLDAAVEAALGKHRPNEPRIVIGTQTLEQSLDIDADLLITDICPMDVLLQRIGRLHRHDRVETERAAGFRSPQAWVLTPTGNDFNPMLTRPANGLGRHRDGGGIYPDLRIIEATARLIESRPLVQIPEDNRLLVESATHPASLRTIERGSGDAWERLGQNLEGDTGANCTTANLHILEVDKEFPMEPGNGFPTDYKIASRLGAQDKLVQFDPPLDGPFGEPLHQLPIRHHLLPSGLDPDAIPQRVLQMDGVVEFQLGDKSYRYDRLGLRKLVD